jgi:DNA repair protein RecO (recombination protein O)
MAPIQDQALVLRRLDYSENSQVLAFFTREHGSHRLLAKGIKRGTKKRFAPGIDLLEHGELLFLPSTRAEGRLGTLVDWHQQNSFLAVRKDLQSWYAAQYGAEVTLAMTEPADPHPALFDALVRFFQALCVQGGAAVCVVAYQRFLLGAVGLWPELGRCVICGREAPPHRAAYYSIHQGGLICRACRAGYPDARLVNAAVLGALRRKDFGSVQISAVMRLLDETIAQTIGRPTLLRHATLLDG